MNFIVSKFTVCTKPNTKGKKKLKKRKSTSGSPSHLESQDAKILKLKSIEGGLNLVRLSP